MQIKEETRSTSLKDSLAIALEEKELPSYEQTLLNFTAKLLEGRFSYPSKSKEEEVWKETLEILGEMFSRGVLSYLAHEDGWQKRLHISDTVLKTGRLWEHPEFKYIELKFGEASLQLLLALFRLLQNKMLVFQKGQTLGKQVKKDNRDKKEDEGKETIKQILQYTKEITLKGSPSERLLVHLISRPFNLKQNPQFGEPLEAMSGWNGWNQLTVGLNPIFLIATNPSSVKATLEEWGWTFPWTATNLSSWWLSLHDKMLSSHLGHYKKSIQNLTSVMEMVFEPAINEGHEDWLLPLMVFFVKAVKNYSKGPEKTIEPLEELLKEEPIKVSQQNRDAWGEMLRYAVLMSDHRTNIRKIHPADRNASQKLFLSYWETLGMDEAVCVTEAMRTHLEMVVG